MVRQQVFLLFNFFVFFFVNLCAGSEQESFFRSLKHTMGSSRRISLPENFLDMLVPILAVAAVIVLLILLWKAVRKWIVPARKTNTAESIQHHEQEPDKKGNKPEEILGEDDFENFLKKFHIDNS